MNKFSVVLKALCIFFKNASLYCIIHAFTTIFSASKIYVLAVINKKLLNEIVEQISNHNLHHGIIAIGRIIIMLFLVEFLYSTVNSLSKYYMSKLAMVYQDRLRISFLNKMSSVDVAFFDSPNQRDEMTQANKDMISIEALFKNVVSLITAIVSSVLSIIIIVKLDSLLTLAVLISLIPPFVLKKKIQKDNYQQEKELNTTNRKINYFSGLFNNKTVASEMRLFDFSGLLIEKLKELHMLRNNKKLQLSRRNVALELLTLIVSGILNISYHLYIIFIVLQDNLTIGDYNYYSTIAGNFKGNVEIILNTYSTILVNIDRVNCYFTFIEKPNDIKNGSRLVSRELDKHKIEFINVSFAYPNTKRKIIERLSFSITSGDKVALAGLNGAGKSTVIKLLLRLYDPTDGVIYCDGVDIREYDLYSYRSLFSATFQSSTSYSLSLRENIAISDINNRINEDLVLSSLDSSGLNVRIEDLKMEVGRQFDKEGIILSPGQKQAMLIARSLYRHSNFAIFDEPAASLDASVEQQIFERIFSESEEKTIVLISHRLSNLKKVDTIIFLEDGRAAEIGSHEQLMELRGKYYKLYRTQADRY